MSSDEVRAAMAIRIVRLGRPRRRGEGLRIGTVRRPPRGVPKAKYAELDYYDVWLPTLAPSPPLVRAAMQKTDGWWPAFARRFRAEMKRPEASHLLDTLAALSHQSNFSIGCYCEEESRCHRSLLRELLEQRHARIAP